MTESSHNLTGVKTILSVRAQRQHLFVLDKMIPTLIYILFSARSSSTTSPYVRCSVSFPQKQYTTKILKNRRYPPAFIPICADALAAEWMIYMNRQDLGLLIKKCREKRGLTQKQLAEIIGISAPCMSNIERGVNFPDIENFFAIVDALNISLDSLLKNESGSALLLADNKPYREKYNELSRESKLTVLHLIDDLWERNV